jgi:hypothetical protein
LPSRIVAHRKSRSVCSLDLPLVADLFGPIASVRKGSI